MGNFQVRYNSGVVNYDRRGFIRLATDCLGKNLPNLRNLAYFPPKIIDKESKSALDTKNITQLGHTENESDFKNLFRDNVCSRVSKCRAKAKVLNETN